MIRVIELFAGIGSQTQALKNIGIEHEIVAISEIDKYAIRSYEALHGAANNLGDIREIPELPKADMWTYSFPCQDISVAGKLAGIKENTRSGLLMHVERLLLIAQQQDRLPKYLLLENVKNLVGKKFKADYDKWLAFLSSLGYANYWQVLNAKHYGIPQNRERVFCLSILGDHAPYRFPEKKELKLRLRDMIDDTVDKRYYLSEQALKGILNTNFTQHKKRIITDEVCQTLCARDFKFPQCIKAGDLSGGKWDKIQEHCRRVYDTEGIAPTVHCAGGGNTEPKIIEDFYSGREPRVYEDTAPTIRSGRDGLKVIAGQYQPVDRDYSVKGKPREEHFECRNDELSNAVLTGDRKNCVKIVALRGRNPDNPSDRTPGIHLEQTLEENSEGICNALTTVQKDNLLMEEEPAEPQVLTSKRTEYGKLVRKKYESGEVSEQRKNMRQLEPRQDGVSNTLTTVQKDNLVMEPNTFVGRAYKRFVSKKGYIPELFNAYNRAEIKTSTPTITTQCGSPTASGSILKAETDEVSKCIRVGGHGWHYHHTWDVVAVNEATKKGYAEAAPGDGVNTQYPASKTRRGRVGKGITGSLLCNESNAVVTDNVRIRKLTERECLRLMGWVDSQIDKIVRCGMSKTQMYKQAGNGIVVQVLEAIFKALFFING